MFNEPKTSDEMAGKVWTPRLELTPWQDRRRRVRADCRLEVTTDMGTSRMTGYVMDLSWTGFRLETSRPVPSGSLVQMAPPNDQPGLRCWCVCRWSCSLPERRGAAPAFLSGHEFMSGTLSPSEGWVRQSLARLGMEEGCLGDRRRTPRFSTHLPAQVVGRDEVWGEITNISRLGANLVLPCPVFDKPLQLLVPVAGHEIRLECSRRATRLLRGTGFSNHVSWEHLPAQIRAVTLWLRKANAASPDKP